MDGQQMSMLENFGLRYLRGELPHWFTAVWLTINTVPIHKTAQHTLNLLVYKWPTGNDMIFLI